jgi:hypothetical protein
MQTKLHTTPVKKTFNTFMIRYIFNEGCDRGHNFGGLKVEKEVETDILFPLL